MTFAHTPVFPNLALAASAVLPSASATDTTIITAPSTYGCVIMGPILAYKNAAGARVIDIKMTVGAVTTTLARVNLSGGINTTVNLLSSLYIAGINDNDPRLILPPSAVLKITTTDSVAGAIDITALNVGSYEYQA